MQLDVLGAGPAYSNRPDAIGAAYLLRAGDSSLLLDLGQGAFARLAAMMEPSRLAAVAISASFGGYGPAIAAVVGGFLALDFFFEYPPYTFEITALGTSVDLLAFLFVAILLGTLNARLRVARRRASAARAQAEAALQVRDEALAIVSHDLRTPLTAIMMAATALDATRPTSANVSEVREQVLDAATRLGRLIEKLLDLSVLQAGGAEPRLVWYSIDEVLAEAVEQLSAGDVVFKLSVEEGLPLLQGDPAQLERAFANVLENAARHSDGKPVSVRARVIRERIRVLISDQGPGIPASEHERIFLPFYRVPGSSAHDSSSGLGLAITRGFLELNGGRVRVESTPPAGTTFVVEFPLPERELAPAAAPSAAFPD